jgi:hypothetical protein
MRDFYLQFKLLGRIENQYIYNSSPSLSESSSIMDRMPFSTLCQTRSKSASVTILLEKRIHSIIQ